MKRFALAGTLAACLVIGLSTATASAFVIGGAFVSQTQTSHSANVYTYSVTWGTKAGPFLGGGTMNLDVLWHGTDFTEAGTGILQGTLAGCPGTVAQGFTWTGSGEEVGGRGGPLNATNNPPSGESFEWSALVISNTSSTQASLELVGETSPEGTFFAVESYRYYCGGHLHTQTGV